MNVLISILTQVSFNHVVLYGCETWSFTLREDHTLKVYENRGLGRILGPRGIK
jgi:hypothetical protein